MIRLATAADISAIIDIYRPYILGTTATFEYTVPSREEFLERFRAITDRFPWLVWEEQGQILGYAYGSLPFERAAFAWCASVSIYLRQEAQHKKIGTKLYQALEICLKAQGYQLIYAVISDENPGSVAFHERQGFTRTGNFPGCGIKFQRRVGVIWMEKRLNSVEIPITAPVRWPDIVCFDEKFKDILDKITLF